MAKKDSGDLKIRITMTLNYKNMADAQLLSGFSLLCEGSSIKLNDFIKTLALRGLATFADFGNIMIMAADDFSAVKKKQNRKATGESATAIIHKKIDGKKAALPLHAQPLTIAHSSSELPPSAISTHSEARPHIPQTEAVTAKPLVTVPVPPNPPPVSCIFPAGDLSSF
jgi:hypothetical protein